jgi:hypothetical protein
MTAADQLAPLAAGLHAALAALPPGCDCPDEHIGLLREQLAAARQSYPDIDDLGLLGDRGPVPAMLARRCAGQLAAALTCPDERGLPWIYLEALVDDLDPADLAVCDGPTERRLGTLLAAARDQLADWPPPARLEPSAPMLSVAEARLLADQAARAGRLAIEAAEARRASLPFPEGY